MFSPVQMLKVAAFPHVVDGYAMIAKGVAMRHQEGWKNEANSR